MKASEASSVKENREINCLALDFGASSGRLMLGKYDGQQIELTEIHRFANEPVVLNKRVYWDFLRLMHEVKVGLKKVAALNITIESIGVDSWGVDYGFLDRQGNLMQNPIHYRDSRTTEIFENIDKLVSKEEIYLETGIQHMSLNTLYQLLSDKEIRPEIYESATTLLLIPDLFNYFLSGVMKNEYTEATTSQLVNPHTKEWNYKLMDKLGLRKELFCEIVMPGTVLGKFTKELEEEVNLRDVKVIAVASHDTASAVVAAPLVGQNSAFLSSGTWSLLGKELDAPLIAKGLSENSFTNEGGAENKITYINNITGLWLVQQLRNHWDIPVSFSEIMEAAALEKEKPFCIDANALEFSFPQNMAKAIADHCEKKGQGRPKTLGEHAIAVYRGLTNEYNSSVKALEELTGTAIETICIVGGGVQNALLCQMTADATGKKIVTGPVEAATLGNILIQLKALGQIKDLEEGRSMIKNSFESIKEK